MGRRWSIIFRLVYVILGFKLERDNLNKLKGQFTQIGQTFYKINEY